MLLSPNKTGKIQYLAEKLNPEPNFTVSGPKVHELLNYRPTAPVQLITAITSLSLDNR
jgi:hypothetical protein